MAEVIEINDFKPVMSPAKKKPAIATRLENSPRKKVNPSSIAARLREADLRRQTIEKERVTKAQADTQKVEKVLGEYKNKENEDLGDAFDVDVRVTLTPKKPKFVSRLENSPKPMSTPEKLAAKQKAATERRQSFESDRVRKAKADVAKTSTLHNKWVEQGKPASKPISNDEDQPTA
eukprot:TRINITY_DN4244_c0_g1_i2.p3 TRINITY_DN4244_c0_g1~~TRINITY_DN4244_c0_g1_i2.p3  ORF type:complete len:177 (-),score=67.64 TRINITY_DN4244_c0_g1_i2:1893-2423(-)